MKLIVKHKIILLALILMTGSMWAQSQREKLKERFDVSKDVTIDVDTRYVDVVFETWNKNEVSVEAYVEGEGISRVDLNAAANSWELSVSGDRDEIVIRSEDSFDADWEDLNIDLGNLEEVIAGSISIVEPIMKDLVGPLIEGFTDTELPAEFYKELEKIEFDHKAYEREGRAYLKRYEKEVEKSFGPEFDEAIAKWEKELEDKLEDGDLSFIGNFADIPQWPFGDSKSIHFNTDEYEKDKKAYVKKLNKKYNTNVSVKEVDRWLEDLEEWGEEFGERMSEWGENFGENFEIWGEEFGKSMGKWGENFGENLEKAFEDWGESFGKDMEKWGEDLGRKMEKWAEEHEADFERLKEEDEHGNKRTHIRLNHDSDNGGSKVKRKIIVKMPKDAELDLDVRYGKVKVADVYNPRIKIAHGSLAAVTIDGGETSIDASYSPVRVNSWKEGSLTTNHVKECVLNTVGNIVLNSSSSNVIINALNGSGIISGSFGQLSISKIGADFGNLNAILENSEMVLELPATAFNFSYNGDRNDIFIPNKLETKSTKTGNTEIINGYHRSRNTPNLITISAKYSDVVLK